MLTTKKEQAVKEHDLLFQYLELLPVPALIGREDKYNHCGRILRVNQKFIHTIGYQATDIPDHVSFASKAYPDINYRYKITQSWQENITKFVNSEESMVELCSKIFCKDQQYRWFNISIELKNITDKGMMIVLFNNIDKAKVEALTDPLTTLANRRYMEQLLQQEQFNYEHSIEKIPFSLVMADIDCFKKINDRYGHSCGDYVIKKVAKIIRYSIRKVDNVARWGGEEYLLLLPKTKTTEARITVKKMMKQIKAYDFRWEDEHFSVSLTYGITEYLDTEDTTETIQRADHYLYQGKEMGRDCIVADGLLEVWGA
jgi:diguanylate cyclase (GGDEF)-like protein